jgi:protein O-mannosyl-transferase
VTGSGVWPPRYNSRVTRSRRRPGTTVERSSPTLIPLFALSLVTAGLWAYANSFRGPFVLDDVPGIVRNPSIQSLWPSQWFAAPPGSTPSGRPVLNLTLALNYALGGLDVAGYHALNLAVHLAAGLALFGVVRRTLRSDRLRASFDETQAAPLAFAAALLWIVHPLNTEAVTYVVQRGESLAALFMLLTLYCAIRGWTWAAGIACALGMGSKETAIVTPALVVLWDHLFREGGARRWRLYGALAATLVVLFLPMLAETQGRTAVSRLLGYTPKAPGDVWTPLSYLWTQAGVIVHYLALAFRPWPLVFDFYDWPPAHSPLDVLPQTALLVCLLALTVAAIVRKWPAGFAGAVFFLALAPTSSLLPIPTEVAAEHRMYLPLAAVIATALTAALALARSQTTESFRARRSSWLRIGTAILLAALFIGSALLTRARNRDYASDAALWGDTVSKRPGNARARINYGIDFMTDGRYADAERQMRAALPLEMDPETRGQVYLQLGSAVAAQHRYDEGIALLERSVQIDPSIKTADLIMGQAYADQGNDALAVRHFLRALEQRPDMPLLLKRAGWVLATSRDPAVRDGIRAAALAEHAVEVTSGQDAVAYEGLAAAYAEQGRRADALAAMDRALALARSHGDASTSTLYEKQRAFYAAGGRVGTSSR